MAFDSRLNSGRFHNGAARCLARRPIHLPPILARDFGRLYESLHGRKAGIAKKDEGGRVVDIHALRHTFGTHLSKAGVAPRVAMAAMRHSSLDLTMNIYTDPVLLDLGAAVDALPAFSADMAPFSAVER
jgi:integrase